MIRNRNILITGGSGTLGMELIRRAYETGWNSRITILSRDTIKQNKIKRQYPDVHCVIGDVRDWSTVYNAMAGKDLVIHAAAVKHIPISEENSIDTYQINVEGSLNVANAAVQHGVADVVGISTDKSCHPANAYGATKYLMEKIYQEFSRADFPTLFHLVRYGNVLESTASVIEVWKEQILRGEPIRITDPSMTRFWLSPAQAAKLVEDVLELESGTILVPKLKALSIQKMMEYTIGEPKTGIQYIPLRAGEKLHETLVTIEETEFSREDGNYYFIRPTTTPRNSTDEPVLYPFSSDMAEELTKGELLELLENELPA